MKAVAKLAPKPGALELVDLPVPKRRKGEVLLRTLAAGICGTDVSLWHWREAIAATYAPDFPLILGHEFAGEVVECDANARVSVGDIVAVNPQVGCGQCITGSRGYNDTT
jgi:threonine dehydrogenase-like Zn-dependent dehydrogenase